MSRVKKQIKAEVCTACDGFSSWCQQCRGSGVQPSRVETKPMKKQTTTAKKATTGFGLSTRFCKFPDGRVVYGPVWAGELAKDIDRAIAAAERKAARKELRRCTDNLLAAINNPVTDRQSAKVLEQAIWIINHHRKANP